MWRSIMSAQEAIKAGCRKRIRDGGITKVWKVPWLPCPNNGLITTAMVPELQDVKVNSLISMETGLWDHDILQDLFNDRDKGLIQRISLPLQRKSDTWFWLLDVKGQFTVKSVYKHLQGGIDMSYSNFWNKLWSLKIPGRDCLSTLTALASKHVNVSTRCPWCHSDSEADIHVLFECGFAKTVWEMVGLQGCVLRLHNESCLDVFVRIFENVTKDQCAMVGMVC